MMEQWINRYASITEHLFEIIYQLEASENTDELVNQLDVLLVQRDHLLVELEGIHLEGIGNLNVSGRFGQLLKMDQELQVAMQAIRDKNRNQYMKIQVGKKQNQRYEMTTAEESLLFDRKK